MIVSRCLCSYDCSFNLDLMRAYSWYQSEKWMISAKPGTELSNLQYIVSLLYCTFFLYSIYSSVLSRWLQGKELCQWIIWCWGERWREGKRKCSADLSVRLPAAKLSSLCFSRVINSCLCCWKTASHFLCSRFIGILRSHLKQFGHI